MIKTLQGVYRVGRGQPATIDRITLNAIVLFAEEDGTLTDVFIKLRQLIVGTAFFKLAKNASIIVNPDDASNYIKIVGSDNASISGYSTSFVKGDMFVIDIASMSNFGHITSPFSVQLKYTTTEGVQKSIGVTTASLANNAVENGTVVMAKGFVLNRIVADKYCRIRLYKTSAYRTADAARAFGSRTYRGTEHGMICDVKLNASTGLDWDMSPDALGSNADTVRNTSVYYAIQNLSGSTGTVTVTFYYTVTEV